MSGVGAHFALHPDMVCNPQCKTLPLGGNSSWPINASPPVALHQFPLPHGSVECYSCLSNVLTPQWLQHPLGPGKSVQNLPPSLTPWKPLLSDRSLKCSLKKELWTWWYLGLNSAVLRWTIKYGRIIRLDAWMPLSFSLIVLYLKSTCSRIASRMMSLLALLFPQSLPSFIQVLGYCSSTQHYLIHQLIRI